VGRFGEPAYEAEEAAILGKARLIREGQSVAVITTGELANEANKASEILGQEGIFPVVYQMHTIKPLDIETLNRLNNKVHTIIIVEEHVPMGGVWSAVCMWHSLMEKGPRLMRLGAPDTYALENLKLGDLRRRFQIDADSIAKACRQAWRG
jgi:transketolase C-terminal domain/subunit